MMRRPSPPISKQVKALSKAKMKLQEEREHIAGLLLQAKACAERAMMSFEIGRHGEAKAELEKGCDLEFEALGDCEALGGLSEALYPDEDRS